MFAGAVVVRSGLESHHETNMDVSKRFQLEGDVRETEKMTGIMTGIMTWILAWMLTW